MDEILEQLKNEGARHSRGYISVNFLGLKQRYEHKQQPALFLLKVVQFAVASGASSLRIKRCSSSVVCSLGAISPNISPESLLDPFAAGLPVFVQYLRDAVLCALAQGLRSVRICQPDEHRGEIRRWDLSFEGIVVSSSALGQHPSRSTEISFMGLPRQFLSFWRALPEHLLGSLEKRCRLGPLSLTLDAKRLKPDVGTVPENSLQIVELGEWAQEVVGERVALPPLIDLKAWRIFSTTATRNSLLTRRDFYDLIPGLGLGIGG